MSREYLQAVRINNDFNLADISLDEYVTSNSYTLTSLSYNAWVVGEKDIYDIKAFVEQQGIPLHNWNLTINYGVKTGLNEAFIIPDDIKKALEDKR